jgi:hypothetical protein
MVARICNADYKGTACLYLKKLRMACHCSDELEDVGVVQLFWGFGLLFFSYLENCETYRASTDTPQLRQF